MEIIHINHHIISKRSFYFSIGFLIIIKCSHRILRAALDEQDRSVHWPHVYCGAEVTHKSFIPSIVRICPENAMVEPPRGVQKSWGFRDRESVGRNRDETLDEEPRLEPRVSQLGTWIELDAGAEEADDNGDGSIFNYAHLSNSPTFFFFCLSENENLAICARRTLAFEG